MEAGEERLAESAGGGASLVQAVTVRIPSWRSFHACHSGVPTAAYCVNYWPIKNSVHSHQLAYVQEAAEESPYEEAAYITSCV